MSGFWLFVLICGAIAGLEMIFLQWWDMRTDATEKLTLSNLLLGAALTVCPLINTFVALGCTIYILVEICPKIVLLGPKT